MNIVLTGFMASGKTTVGRRIEEVSDYKMIDTDELIERSEGMSINEIFEKKGEDAFRKIESDIIKQVSEKDNVVISTGGGVPLNPRNIETLRRHGMVFNLQPEFEVIAARINEAAKTRPLLKNQSIDDIKKRFESRLAAYSNCDYAIHINSFTTVDDCVNEILKTISEIGQRAD